MANSPYSLDIKIDATGFENRLKSIKKALNKRVRVGILHAESEENGATTAEIASWNEGDGFFGANDTPQRSVIGLPLSESMYREDIIDAGLDVLEKEGVTAKGVKKALKAIGETAHWAILSAFDSSANGQWAKNSKETLKKKIGEKPMIDTGTLVSNIEWEVVDGE